MSDLEETIRKLAAKGEITHLTLAPTHNKGKLTWQGGYRDASSMGYRIGIADDPVDALMEALTTRHMEPSSNPPPKRSRGKDLI